MRNRVKKWKENAYKKIDDFIDEMFMQLIQSDDFKQIEQHRSSIRKSLTEQLPDLVKRQKIVENQVQNFDTTTQKDWITLEERMKHWIDKQQRNEIKLFQYFKEKVKFPTSMDLLG